MGKHQSIPRSTRQRRLLEYQKGNRKAAMLGIAAVVLIGVTVFVALRRGTGAEVAIPPAAEVLPAGKDARLPASVFADGRAHFYRYTTSTGRVIRVFVIRSSDGVIRAAFDACDMCYRRRRGYYQRGDTMICVNCGRGFHSKDINVTSGGCNPAPLQRSADGRELLLKASDLEVGVAYF
jgi:uncharacterized membrane protein